MKNSSRKRKKKQSANTTGFLAVVLIGLIAVGAVTYMNKDQIGAEKPKKEQSADNPNPPVENALPDNRQQAQSTDDVQPTAPTEPETPPSTDDISVTVVKTEEEPTDPMKPKEPVETIPQSPREAPKETPKEPVEPPIKTEDKQLFFVRYSESTESIEIVPVIRRISYENSPLTQTLSTLLYGPNVAELSKDLITMIPEKSKILSIEISKGIAAINFNEEFMFNPNGREGLEAQLAQIVYTATQFPTVSAVQFLIEGEVRDFLSDGVYIKLPLGRNSF